MTDTSLMYFWISIVPFLLLTVTLSWYMGKLSGIAECNERYGCYSVGYPLAMMFFFLGVLPAMVLANYLGLPDSPAPIFASIGGLVACMASLMLGWRFAARQWKAQHAIVGDGNKEKNTNI